MKKVSNLTVRKPNESLSTFKFSDDAKLNALEAGEYEVFVRPVTAPKWELVPVPGQRKVTRFGLSRGPGPVLEIDTLGVKDAQALLDDLMSELSHVPVQGNQP